MDVRDQAAYRQIAILDTLGLGDYMKIRRDLYYIATHSRIDGVGGILSHRDARFLLRFGMHGRSATGRTSERRSRLSPAGGANDAETKINIWQHFEGGFKTSIGDCMCFLSCV